MRWKDHDCAQQRAKSPFRGPGDRLLSGLFNHPARWRRVSRRQQAHARSPVGWGGWERWPQRSAAGCCLLTLSRTSRSALDRRSPASPRTLSSSHLVEPSPNRRRTEKQDRSRALAHLLEGLKLGVKGYRHVGVFEERVNKTKSIKVSDRAGKTPCVVDERSRWPAREVAMGGRVSTITLRTDGSRVNCVERRGAVQGKVELSLV
ncbi:hypothetical protein DB88DRAFT_188569 [Papiliotrema laurentii]|uniref:Uncharacterized protein n=1 Tax=Papiliotrema laurentii TaxID=5418 RepID=A0AAD9FSE6_PAPLA|nr:hypothetical protein DB88DRAFT_188569 [Papiliotrema laurentii]